MQRDNSRRTGAETDDSVKVTVGGGWFGLVDLPNKMTVSPLKTDWTRATPCLGSTMGGLAMG